MNEERARVLRMLKEGKISVEEADALLQALTEESETSQPPEGPQAQPRTGTVDVRVELWDVVREITQSIPKDVIRELRELRHLKDLKELGRLGDLKQFKLGWRGVLRALQGLVAGQAEEATEAVMVAGERLQVENAWGDVRLDRSPDDRLRMKARKRVWAATAADAAREAEELSVGPRRDGTTVAVGLRRVEGRVRVDLELQVPSGVTVSADVAKGDLRILNLEGELRVHVARGDVQVDGQRGGTELSVLSGDVRLRDVAGNVDIEAKNGDVEIVRARGPLVRARTFSGDVHVIAETLPAGGALNAETMSGDVEISLPREAHATIDAATMSGEVTCALALMDQKTDRGTFLRRTLHGVLNAPGATVTVRTTSGDIAIRGIEQ